MKLINLNLLLLLALLVSCGESSVSSGKWTVSYDQVQKGHRIEKENQLLSDGVYASYKLGNKLVTTRDYKKSSSKVTAISDAFGQGSLLQVTYTDSNLPTLVQSFYIYPEKDYLLTEFTLQGGAADVESNYMAPVTIDRMPAVLAEGDNRALFQPFDNDCWIRYQSHPLTFDQLRSYEVATVFNNDDRNNIGSLVCFGGVADSLTRDSKAHGALKGKMVKSPKVFFGIFNDWRAGLEEYGKANAVVAPVKRWPGAVTFGWNSWGALQFRLNHQNAIEVSDFFKENLQNNHFVNTDGNVTIGLDSGWNSFTEEELKDFVNHCTANGQIPGVYWTPFTDWGKHPERMIKDAPDYKFQDVYLYANGQPQELDGAYAIDPTHPAIEEMMKKTSDLFRRCGFKYVKMDFMTHGAMEADKWYNPEIRTGIQGYNYGMQLLNKYFGDMYLNLSISPVFPAHYANSRRIACDAWNKIKDTEYTLNALSYGWWQDEVYQYNDADHLVLREATEGENRARITSGAITGLYIVGDDFSKGGKQIDKDRALKFLTNPDVNAVAKGVSFSPVEGNGEKSEHQFIHHDADGTSYFAIFNYSEDEMNATISLERMGLDPAANYQAKELWSGNEQPVKEKLTVTVPAKDALLYKIRNN